MKIFSMTAFLLFVFVTHVSAQETLRNISNETETVINCADSASVEFIKVQKLMQSQGKVYIGDTGEEEILAIIEVYEISKRESKVSAHRLATENRPINRIKTNENGEFYFDKLSDGYYVLKIGTDNGGFNCDFMKIRIAKDASNKLLKIRLTPGF